MRIFVAGATGVIGIRLLPLLVEAGHVVAGLTRSPQKAAQVAALGGEPIVCDVFDGKALTEAVVGFAAEAVIHQLTDLPDTLAELPEHGPANCEPRARATSSPQRKPPAPGASLQRVVPR